MSKKKLLVVDDEASISIIIEINLGDTYEIVQFADGQAALNWLLLGNEPTAIVADMNMPELDGLGFIKQVRNSALFKDTPIVVLSSEEASSKKIVALRAGADDYLVKPFNPEELGIRLEKILFRINN